MLKRILSGLLALVLLLGAVPVNAFASEAEMPVVLEEPAVVTEPAAQETPAATEPVLLIPETTEAEETQAPTEGLPEQSVPYVPAVPETVTTTETVQVVKEVEPGIFTTEEQVVTSEHQLPLASLLPRQEDGIMSATITENDNYISFTTFAELKKLCARTYTEETYFSYDGTSDLVISSDVTIPNMAILRNFASAVVVAKGATLRATNSCVLSELTVNGTAYVEILNIVNSLTVNGKLYASGRVVVQNPDGLTGANNVVFTTEWGDFFLYCEVETMAQLQDLITEAKNTLNTRYLYDILPTGDFVISKSITIPDNCHMETPRANSVTVKAGCTLTVNRALSINCDFFVKGTLINNGEISLGARYILTVTGTYSGNGRLLVYVDSDPFSKISGLNEADFQVTEYYDWSHYFELRYIKGLTKLSKPTNLQWHKMYSRVWNPNAGYEYQSSSFKGATSFVPGTVGDGSGVQWYTIRHYKGGNLWNTRCVGWNSAFERVSDYVFVLTDPSDGTYYFTVQMDGDYTTTVNSDAAKSASWTYTKPAAKLGTCLYPVWSGDTASFTAPAANAKIGGYQIRYCYSSTQNGAIERSTSAWSYSNQMPNFTLAEWVTNNWGEGYYSFQIRAFSSDISTVYNGDWSARSAAIYYNGKRPSLWMQNGNDGIPKVNWSKVDGASSYKIYRTNANANLYTLIGTSTTTSYKDSSAMMGQDYYYKVSAVVNGVETLCSDSFWGRRCLPKAVVTLSCNAASGKPILKWKTVTGAAYYDVYVTTDPSQGYFRVQQYNTSLTYTHTDAEPGTRYYYLVVARHSEHANAASESVPKNIVCDLKRPTGLKVTNDAATGKNKVSWNKVTGASKYQVWYSTTGKTGSFKLLYTTKALTFTHQKSEPGKMYYYKVKAIHTNTNANSALTGSYKRTADLARPVVTAGNNATTGKVRLTWKAVTGASKYQVWYSATGKAGTFKLVWTCKNLYFNHNASKVGVTGYYKVMAIHTNTAANSAYSTVVSRAAK